MNKVKMALTVIALLGTVGAVLALKSARVGKFCTAATVNGICPANLKCETGADMKGAPNAVPKCYMVTYTTANCSIDKPTCLPTPDRLIQN